MRWRLLAPAATECQPARRAAMREALAIERKTVGFIRLLVECAIDPSERDLLDDVATGGDPSDLSPVIARIGLASPIRAMIGVPPQDIKVFSGRRNGAS